MTKSQKNFTNEKFVHQWSLTTRNCHVQYAALGTQCSGMNQDEGLFLLKAELARILGVDPRSKEVKAVEPTAYLAGTRNRRIGVYSAAPAESLKERQQEASKRK